MKRAELLEFMRAQRYVVQASVSSANSPQAAVVGIVVTDEFEIFFDTLDSTRKARNLRGNPKIAFVIGGSGPDDQRSMQVEGLADEPAGEELARLKQLYFARFSDGPARESWKGLIYLRARPTWIRFSDYNRDPPVIVEFDAAQLKRGW
jgi:nitroimidazol reductase NimA-like FMN-containing flavoprotein (pyridoxamine 5'-phosphate oxidase superfamily)